MDVHFTLKTAPTSEPVSVAEAKLHLRVTHNSEDQLVDRLIGAARAWVEGYTGRSLAQQTWQLSMNGFADRLWLPRAAPLQSVTFVKYYDTSNVLQTLSSSAYVVPAFSEPAVIDLAYGSAWPSVYDRADAVQVEYVTGYASAAAVPKPLQQAIVLLVGHWYANRESVLVGQISKEIEFAVTALCAPYRVFWRLPECG